MNILLDIFLTFLKIGCVSFGGGYGMISLIREEVLKHGWLTEGELLDFIAVSESTPGPIAINMATFIGSSQAGIWGSVLATLGVVLPSFLIILLIASILKTLINKPIVQNILSFIRPVVCALIIVTGLSMLCGVCFNYNTINSDFVLNIKSIIIFVIITVIFFLVKKFLKKKISPILLIIISACLGIIFNVI